MRLHKNTRSAQFFPDAMAEIKLDWPITFRSAVARNEIFEAVGLSPRMNWTYAATSPSSYTVFPNSVVVFHPDYTSDPQQLEPADTG